MEDILDLQSPEGKVYKDRYFFFMVFLGGPLVAGYFFAQNFKTIGQEHKVQATWVIAILSSILIFTGAFMMPIVSGLPSQLIPISYTAIGYGLYKYYQDSDVDAHIQRGGAVHGWGNVIAVTVVGLLITMLVAGVIALVFGDIIGL